MTAVDRPDNGQGEGSCGELDCCGGSYDEQGAAHYTDCRAVTPADEGHLVRTQPAGEADRTRYESHQWMGGGDDEDCCAACGVSWIDCEGPCNPRGPVRSMSRTTSTATLPGM